MPKVNQNIQTTWQTLLWYACQTVIYVCRVDVPLIFKTARRKKRFIIDVNLKKYPRQIQHHITDLKMELLVKIVNDCKLQTIVAKKQHFRCVTGSEIASDYNESMFLVNNKRATSPFFGTVVLTT